MFSPRGYSRGRSLSSASPVRTSRAELRTGIRLPASPRSRHPRLSRHSRPERHPGMLPCFPGPSPPVRRASGAAFCSLRLFLPFWGLLNIPECFSRPADAIFINRLLMHLLSPPPEARCDTDLSVPSSECFSKFPINQGLPQQPTPFQLLVRAG